MSHRVLSAGCMLGGMYLRVEVRDEDEERLDRLAVEEHRSLKEQASYLLHLKLQELCTLGAGAEPVAEVA